MLDALPIWVRTPAEYEPEGDHIICRWEGSEWIMPIHIAQTTICRLEQAVAKWRAKQSGAIAEFRRDHAASS